MIGLGNRWKLKHDFFDLHEHTLTLLFVTLVILSALNNGAFFPFYINVTEKANKRQKGVQGRN